LTAPELTYGRVFRFYLPLALSWLFMALEMPIAIAVLSRSPDARVHTAAFYVIMSIALWIESPVIDLLATSTTLARGRAAYAALSKFTWLLMLWVTAAHALIAFTPLFDVIAYSWIGLPVPVADSTRLALAIMVPWSACIGWRRYLQGIMIRRGFTRLVGVGTAIRVVTMAGSAFALYVFVQWPASAIVATALVCSVAAEALFIHAASRAPIRETTLAPESPRESVVSHQVASLGKLAAFHFPLTATTMVMMLQFPVIAAALGRSPDKVLSLASWQVAVALLFLLRTVVFALPEAVIALYHDEATARVLRGFCAWVGAAMSALLFALALSGIDQAFFRSVLRADAAVSSMAHVAVLVGAATPFLGAVQSYLRGMLTAHHQTAARLWSILAGMSSLIAMLMAGLAAGWMGVVNASVAMTVSMTVELVVLAAFWARERRRAAMPSPAAIE